MVQTKAVQRLNTGLYDKTYNTVFWTVGALKQHSGFGPRGVTAGVGVKPTLFHLFCRAPEICGLIKMKCGIKHPSATTLNLTSPQLQLSGSRQVKSEPFLPTVMWKLAERLINADTWGSTRST